MKQQQLVQSAAASVLTHSRKMNQITPVSQSLSEDKV